MRLLLILILVFLGFMALRRRIYFKVYSDLQRQMREQDSDSYHAKKEGEVTIDTSRAPKKKTNRDDGDYIDYTEVE